MRLLCRNCGEEVDGPHECPPGGFYSRAQFARSESYTLLEALASERVVTLRYRDALGVLRVRQVHVLGFDTPEGGETIFTVRDVEPEAGRSVEFAVHETSIESVDPT